jgi:hypothetical protein
MVKKILRYVQGTKDLMLTYRRSDSLEIKGYSDADYAGDKDERKSTTGYVFTLAGARGYFVEKLQTDNSCIIHDVCQIYIMF